MARERTAKSAVLCTRLPDGVSQALPWLTCSRYVLLSLQIAILAVCISTANAEPIFNWQTVVNNTQVFPGDTRNFNSYNQPSVNDAGLVVFRARTQGGSGGGEPQTGILTRDMSNPGSPLNVIATRDSVAPVPAFTPAVGYTYDATGATFNEFPSIPRIDHGSSTVGTRGQTPPVIEITDPMDVKTSVGTSAIYVNPGGFFTSAIGNLGNQPGFERYLVPGQPLGTKFDQFPGSPSITDGSKVVFKGNFSGGTGVYWTDAADSTAPIYRIADNTMPGQAFTGGSTAPPSAASGKAVFLGVDNEESPSQGGIYLTELASNPTLQSIVSIGDVAPGFDVNPDNTFSRIGEALSFDGRYVAFWAGVGDATTPLTLECPTDGNQALIDYCMELYPDGFTTSVPTYQGIYVADTTDGTIDLVASTWGDDGFTDFLYWVFSGRPPGMADDSLELARWRSSNFLAVDDGMVAFKGSKGSDFGIYLSSNPSGNVLKTVAESGDDGGTIDPDAAGLPIIGLALERDGFRNGWLAISASMADDVSSMAGIYTTDVPEPGTITLAFLAIGIATFACRHHWKKSRR